MILTNVHFSCFSATKTRVIPSCLQQVGFWASGVTPAREERLTERVETVGRILLASYLSKPFRRIYGRRSLVSQRSPWWWPPALYAPLLFLLWDLPLMTSAKFLGFWPPSPPCPHLDLIYTIKFTQPLLLHPLFHDPPSSADVIYGRFLGGMRIVGLDLNHKINPLFKQHICLMALSLS